MAEQVGRLQTLPFCCMTVWGSIKQKLGQATTALPGFCFYSLYLLLCMQQNACSTFLEWFCHGNHTGCAQSNSPQRCGRRKGTHIRPCLSTCANCAGGFSSRIVLVLAALEEIKKSQEQPSWCRKDVSWVLKSYIRTGRRVKRGNSKRGKGLERSGWLGPACKRVRRQSVKGRADWTLPSD